MAGRKTKLTSELIESISKEIALGVWDYIAAECVGISQATFYSWLADARNEDCTDKLKLEFLESVTQAKAKARATAEKSILLDKPEVWLLKGSARHRPQRDGWSTQSTVTLDTTDNTEVVLSWGDNEDATES